LYCIVLYCTVEGLRTHVSELFLQKDCGLMFLNYSSRWIADEQKDCFLGKPALLALLLNPFFIARKIYSSCSWIILAEVLRTDASEWSYRRVANWCFWIILAPWCACPTNLIFVKIVTCNLSGGPKTIETGFFTLVRKLSKVTDPCKIRILTLDKNPPPLKKALKKL